MNILNKFLIIALLAFTPVLIAEEENGIKFQAVACPTTLNLQNGINIYSLLIALKVTNETASAVIVNTQSPLLPILKNEKGETIGVDSGADMYIPAGKSDYTDVDPKHSIYLPVSATISLHEKGFDISGKTKSGASWVVKNLPKGKYNLALSYNSTYLEPHAVRNDFWRGNIKTEFIQINIK